MPSGRRGWPHLGVATLALVAIVSTLAIARGPDRSTSRFELATAHYGYPLWFVEAELPSSRASGPNPAVRLNPWEYPTKTDYSRLLLSWVAVAAMPLALVWWYERRRSSGTTVDRRKSEA